MEPASPRPWQVVWSQVPAGRSAREAISRAHGQQADPACSLVTPLDSAALVPTELLFQPDRVGTHVEDK